MVTPEVARQFHSRGIGLVSVPAGRSAAWLEMNASDTQDVRVLIGAGPWLEPGEPTASNRVSPVARSDSGDAKGLNEDAS